MIQDVLRHCTQMKVEKQFVDIRWNQVAKSIRARLEKSRLSAKEVAGPALYDHRHQKQCFFHLVTTIQHKQAQYDDDVEPSFSGSPADSDSYQDGPENKRSAL